MSLYKNKQDEFFTIFYGIADFLQWTFQFFDAVGNKFNYSMIVLGFVGLFYWLNLQRKLTAKAEKEGKLK